MGRKRREDLLPDTHAHLDSPSLYEDLDEVVGRAQGAGVRPILAVGEDLATSRRAVELAQRYDIVFAAVGIHPHMAGQFEADGPELEELLDKEKVVAIGEIGLDYARGSATPEQQREAFHAQLLWARSRRLPVSVHNREADEDVLKLLEELDGPGILHCFSSGPAIAHRALEMGLYLSFAGNITFPKAYALREVAVHAPADRLLVETDSPVLSPQQWRGKRNEPAYIVATARLLASLRGTTLEDLSECVANNAERVFHWGVA